MAEDTRWKYWRQGRKYYSSIWGQKRTFFWLLISLSLWSVEVSNPTKPPPPPPCRSWITNIIPKPRSHWTDVLWHCFHSSSHRSASVFRTMDTLNGSSSSILALLLVSWPLPSKLAYCFLSSIMHRQCPVQPPGKMVDVLTRHCQVPLPIANFPLGRHLVCKSFLKSQGTISPLFLPRVASWDRLPRLDCSSNSSYVESLAFHIFAHVMMKGNCVNAFRDGTLHAILIVSY